MGDAIPPGAAVKLHQNLITFSKKEVRLTVLGSSRSQNDETLRIAGLVKPTFVVPKDAHVQIRFMSADPNMAHNIVVASVSPPSSYMTMGWVPLAFEGAATAFLDPPSETRCMLKTSRLVWMSQNVTRTDAPYRGMQRAVCTASSSSGVIIRS